MGWLYRNKQEMIKITIVTTKSQQARVYCIHNRLTLIKKGFIFFLMTMSVVLIDICLNLWCAFSLTHLPSNAYSNLHNDASIFAVVLSFAPNHKAANLVGEFKTNG